MAGVQCGRCGWENDPATVADRCVGCGRKLPGVGNSAPGDEVEQAEKAARKNAATVLFSIAVLHLVCNSSALAFAPDFLAGVPIQFVGRDGAFALILGITAVFVCLGAWAWVMPLPASSAGLACYVGLLALEVALGPKAAVKGWIHKLVFILALGQAIVAASKARRLRAARDGRDGWGENEERW
jgi:hypothetical protein